MDEQSEWVRRVEESTSATAHQQVRLLLDETRAHIVRLGAAVDEKSAAFEGSAGTAVEAALAVVSSLESIAEELRKLRLEAADQRESATAAVRADLAVATQALEAHLEMRSERVLAEVTACVAAVDRRLDQIISSIGSARGTAAEGAAVPAPDQAAARLHVAG